MVNQRVLCLLLDKEFQRAEAVRQAAQSICEDAVRTVEQVRESRDAAKRGRIEQEFRPGDQAAVVAGGGVGAGDVVGLAQVVGTQSLLDGGGPGRDVMAAALLSARR